MGSSERVYTACLIIIGNEILSGRTKDQNLAFIGVRLNERGIRLREVRVIPDVMETIVETVNESRPKFDYVFTTGGIGPTHDDITADSIARAFGVENTLNDEAYQLLLGHYGSREKINDARIRMAHTPAGAQLIHNPVSLAPGFQMENVFVMAGVPRIMQVMFDGLGDRLVGGTPLKSRAIDARLPEGVIAKGLGEVQARFAAVDIGSYPYFRDGRSGCTLVLRGADETLLDQAAEEVRALVRSAGGDPSDEVVSS
ncbi:MAG: molybdopterin-binding protein [Proteobacteria bacterium]|nr:molybdopterin-binding protein [Pseudomonadota bacterium]MDA1057130.1 molybdopterin-binding protein [Pseudomonadota bacterium]